MEKETPTDETQVDASHVNAATGDEAATSVDSLTLEAINEITGKDYKDTDTALKSIKDMSKQAGKASDLEGKLRAALEQPKEEAPEAETPDEVNALKAEIASIKTENFFAQNPSHAENRDLLEALAKANNVSLTDAVNLPAYKGVMDKIESAQPKRTVAASNSRVAQASEDTFNPADHAGDADTLAKHVFDNYITK